jgi:predicted Zn finger-like uncharacterized protein
MYSQCPECLTRFRVTAEALRAARGTVRCGRCGNAFDALSGLSDTVPPARAAASDERAGAGLVRAGPSEAAAVAEYHFTADDLEKIFVGESDWEDLSGPGPAPDASETLRALPAEPPVVMVDEGEPVEDITLEGERISIEAPPEFDLDSTDEFEVLGNVPDSAYPDEENTGELPVLDVAATGELPPAPEPEATSTEVGVLAEPGITAEAVVEAADAGPPATTLAAQRWRRRFDDEPAESPDRPHHAWRTLAWSAGCLLLALALLAQLAHHYRQDLVRHPQLGPVLRDAYDRLGLPLSPNWDLAAFELRQWGNGGGPASNGRMSIRSSLTNRADFAQPHPILRLELEDRFGESIAVRDFEPGEYLKNPSEASRLLGAGASTEAELVIVDPGQDAVGYRLDVCLRESATLLRCAQGPG